MFLALAEIVLSRRLLFGVGVLAFFALLVGGVAALRVDFSARGFFAGEGIEAEHLDRFKAYWGEDDDGLIVVADGSGDTILQRKRLELLEALGEDLRKDADVSRVYGLVDVPRFKRDFLGATRPVPLLSTMPRSDEGGGEWTDWRKALLADSLLVPALLSEDGEFAALVIELSLNVDDIALIRPVVERLVGVVDGFDGQQGLSLSVGGIPMVRSLVSRMILDEQLRLVPIALCVVLFLLFLLFRNASGMVVPLVSAVLPTIMLFGLMGWVGEPISLLNQAYFTLIPVIAVADAIHMVSRFREEIWRNTPEGELPSPQVRDAAVTKAMQHVGAACLMTTLTTVVGFLSLVLAQMPVLRSFGLYAAAGMALSYGCVLIVVPLLLTSARPRVVGSHSGGGLLGRFLRGCANISLGRPRTCLFFTLAICVVAVFLGGRVVVNNWVTRTLPPELPASEANRLVDSELGGLIALRYDLEGEPGSFARPEVLQALEALEVAAAGFEGVRWTSSPASFLAQGSRILGGPLQVPQTQRLVDHIYQRVEGSEARERVVSPDTGRAQLVIYCQDVGALRFAELREMMDLRVEDALSSSGIQAYPSGTPVVAYAGINHIVFDLRDSLVMAFFVVTVLLTLLVQNVRLGLICVLPNALPLLVGYGMLGLLGWDLEPATGVVFTVALGIAVDDTIHLVARYLEELRSGRPQKEALTNAIVHSGRAVLVTTVVLATGFFVNLLSIFPTNACFGGLGGVVILAALLCDLFVLPPLLLLFYQPLGITELERVHS